MDGRGRDDEECDGRSERPPEDLSLLHGRVAGATKGQAGRDPLFTRGGFVKKEEKEGRRRRRNAYGGHAWRGRGCAGVGRRRLAVEGTGTPGRERRLGQAVGGDRGRWAAGVALGPLSFIAWKQLSMGLLTFYLFCPNMFQVRHQINPPDVHKLKLVNIC